MKGIILAGGTGSRLNPLTKVTNKHLLPVGKYPMIYYPIWKLKEAGIDEIFIVTGKDHAGAIVNLLGSGFEMGLKFTYRIQDQAGGIAQALGLAKEYVRDDDCVVILGDNIFSYNLKPIVEKFKKSTWKEKKEHLHIKIFPFRGNIGQPYTVDSSFERKEVFKEKGTGKEFVKMIHVRKVMIDTKRFNKLARELIMLLKD